MKVSELGEFGLIDLLARIADGSRDSQTASWKQLLIGIGDDAAVWRGDASVQLVTVDSMVQDVHFSLGITPWDDLGWKAMAVMPIPERGLGEAINDRLRRAAKAR